MKDMKHYTRIKKDNHVLKRKHDSTKLRTWRTR